MMTVRNGVMTIGTVQATLYMGTLVTSRAKRL